MKIEAKRKAGKTQKAPEAYLFASRLKWQPFSQKYTLHYLAREEKNIY